MNGWCVRSYVYIKVASTPGHCCGHSHMRIQYVTRDTAASKIEGLYIPRLCLGGLTLHMLY
jgi:hypothetical protein